MNQTENQFDSQLNENDPKELQRIIQKLISKSKILIENLDSTLCKLDKVEQERDFWKNGYFDFKESCEEYVKNHGIAPFVYIKKLESSLKKEQIDNYCRTEQHKLLDQKMCPKRESPMTQKQHASIKIVQQHPTNHFPNRSIDLNNKNPIFRLQQEGRVYQNATHYSQTIKKEKQPTDSHKKETNRSISTVSYGRDSSLKCRHLLNHKKLENRTTSKLSSQ